jgi:membrane dipeptidase
VPADLHCHYPMHVLDWEPQDVTLEQMVRVRGRRHPLQKLRSAFLGVAARLLNFRHWSGGWRVDLKGLEEGDVRVVLSILYQPFDEMDLNYWYGARPAPGYFQALIDHLRDVEDELRQIDPEARRHVFVRSGAELDAALASGRLAFLHCVEGGFHLGGSPEAIRANVAELAAEGVAYVTLAHLFWRQVATNTPAIPFLSDRLYGALFPQPHGKGLTDLGVAAVEAMYDAGVLVDISHMRQDAIDATFALVENLDRRHGADPADFPIIASHVAFRLGGQTYNVTADVVRRIAARGGIVGLILAQHQLNDGVRRRKTTRLEESVEVLCRHIDAIHDATGSYDHIGIGSDLDGFIKPTTGGIEHAADLAKLRDPLAARYGAEVAEQILTGNAIRVLRHFRRARPSRPASPDR